MKKSHLTKQQRQRRSRRKKWTNAERQENVVKNRLRREQVAKALGSYNG